MLAGALCNLVTEEKYIITCTYIKKQPHDINEIHIFDERLKVKIDREPKSDTKCNLKTTNIIPKVDEGKSKNMKKETIN